MTVRSHSRLTNDIYYIPAPTSAKIDVKTIDVLLDDIFVPNGYQDYRQSLFSAEELKSSELYEKYLSKFENKKKFLIY